MKVEQAQEFVGHNIELLYRCDETTRIVKAEQVREHKNGNVTLLCVNEQDGYRSFSLHDILDIRIV